MSDTVVDLGRAQLAVSAGQVAERDGFLGSRTSGPLFAGVATIRFLRFGATLGLSRNVGLRGNYVTATSRIGGDTAVGYAWFSGLRADAGAIDLTVDGLPTPGSRLTLGVAQPLRVAAGRAALSLPQSVVIDAPGSYRYAYDARGVSLVPEGRELDYTIEWSQNLGALTAVTLAGRAMRQPGHDAAGAAGFACFVGLRSAF